jgi:hypothetical protein
VITTLGVRMTLGITVDPESTPANVILWASHSSPSVSSGAANSGAVTRLSGPGLASRQDVITGLPRAIANHAVNSLHFGPDGKLYIAHGGNTGAGAPNTATTEFGTRPEQPLSAALLVADVKAPGFQGSCASPVDDATGTASTLVPPTCDVAVFASGIRNMYDFAFHSNGAIYGPDNGLGVQGTVPTAPVPDCQGTVPYSSALDPGPQPDMLLRLELGGYYGHPNPARDERVFGDGSFQGVPRRRATRRGSSTSGSTARPMARSSTSTTTPAASYAGSCWSRTTRPGTTSPASGWRPTAGRSPPPPRSSAASTTRYPSRSVRMARSTSASSAATR